MCPPSSLETRLARTTMASAFQRTIERSRCSSPGSPAQLLLVGLPDGVDVGGGGRVGQVRARAARLIDQPLDQVVGARGPLPLHRGVEALEPLPRLLGIDVDFVGHAPAPSLRTSLACGSLRAALAAHRACVSNLPQPSFAAALKRRAPRVRAPPGRRGAARSRPRAGPGPRRFRPPPASARTRSGARPRPDTPRARGRIRRPRPRRARADGQRARRLRAAGGRRRSRDRASPRSGGRPRRSRTGPHGSVSLSRKLSGVSA